MRNPLKVVAFLVVAVLTTMPLAAEATLNIFTLHNHPNGTQNPPAYGLRLDDIIGSGEFTFSFDYVDGSGSASMTLIYDDVTQEVHIYGRAYGGKDTGTGWSATLKGWVDIDFKYRNNVSQRDNCAGAAGNDVYVTAESASNNGTITLDGWGGNLVLAYSDKADGSGCTFIFDNDTDPKGNAAIANDPSTYSGSGWLMPPTSGARDWIFIANMVTVPVQERTLGSVKALYNN